MSPLASSITAGWSPARLRVLVGAVTVASVALAGTATWGLVQTLGGEASADTKVASETTLEHAVNQDRQGVTLALPAELAVDSGEAITLPAATAVGPGGVPSGFPRTPQGAVAQLAALDTTVLEGMSIPAAIATGRAWIVPGGPAAENWSVVRGLEALLTTAGQPAQGSTLQLDLTAAMAKVEPQPTGVEEDSRAPGEVVACVDFVLALLGVATEQIAAADCQRMTWMSGRWMIATGPEEPSPASVWPGTPESLSAGWRWVVSPDE